MKDNRKSPLISDLSKSVHTSQGIKKYNVLSYVTFDKFSDTDFSTGALIKDNTSDNQYEVVEGISGALGMMTGSLATLSDFQVYGETVYTDVKVLGNIGLTLPIQQRGLSLPIGARTPAGVPLEPKLVINRSVSELNPSITGQPRCFMLKIKIHTGHTNGPILAFGEPGSAIVSFKIVVAGSNITIMHSAQTSESADTVFAGSVPKDKWLTLFVNAGLDPSTGNPIVGPCYLYDTTTGRLDTSTGLAGPTPTSPIIITDPTLYLGYGEISGGVNHAFSLSDFLSKVDIAELVVFDRYLLSDEVDLIAKSHLKGTHFRSGFNSRAPRLAQQILDAKNSYPISSNPVLPREPASAFNDTTTKIFNSGSLSNSNELLVFPEMLPARLFSGSSIPTSFGGPSFSRGAVGNTDTFYRDIHNTPYDARLVTAGQLKQGLSHKETELFDLSSRNSPITLSKDTALLGGLISPFDDTQPSANYLDVPAVDNSVYPGLQQRLGDHVAIVIDLSPTTDSTIGVERDGSGNLTGRVTSMAYYNFSTKKWETSGENNDFVVSPPKKFEVPEAGTEGSQMAFALAQVNELVNSSSIAFAGTSGFTLFPEEDEPLTPLRNRGAPTSNYGFPQHPKYEAKDAQLIDMSDYIDAPLIVERVSFEFGAAIEDSGPHSLGYARNSIPANIEAGGAPITDVVSTMGESYPSIASGWSAAKRMGMNTTRAEFINGSRVKGFKGLFNEVPNQTRYFLSSSALDINALLASPNGWNINSNNLDPAIECKVRPHRQPPGMAVGPVDARIFLRTSFGPRWSPSDEGSKIAGPMSVAHRKIEDVDGNQRAFSSIPILAGGVNGMVTGTIHLQPISYNGPSGPYAALESNRASAEANSFDKNNFMNLAPGGTPFWRADSFFLLRQTTKPITKKVNYSIGVRSGYRTAHYPCAPWVAGETLQESYFYSGPNAPGSINMEKWGVKFVSASLAESKGKDLFMEIAFSGSTSREVITFGQMSHFGYTTAADSYMDSDHRLLPNFSSGAIDQTSQSQLFDQFGNARLIPFMGQAIKFARCNDFQYTAIPINPENHVTRHTGSAAEHISLSSDFPDTSQGMYSSQAVLTQRASQWYEADYPIALYGNTTPHTAVESRNIGLQARYVMTGVNGNATGVGNTYCISLDTYAGYPMRNPSGSADFVQGAFKDEMNIYGGDYSVARRLAGSGMSSIATPAYICDPDIDPQGDYTNFFHNYGTFDTPGKFTTAGWLSAGLSKDLNIELRANSTHQGTNYSFDDNYCGFTLMTASTIGRPNAPHGRESAALPLRADVYKRQYLNFRKDFSISVPVRSITPSSTEPAGSWVFTTKPNTGNLQGHNLPYTSIPQPKNYPQNGGRIPPTNVGTGNDAEMWTDTERYSKRHTTVISQGGWSPGTSMDGMPSGRSFIRAALASTPTKNSAIGPLIFGGATTFRIANDGLYGNLSWSDTEDSFMGSILSGTQPEKNIEDSLYILKPGDKLVLGVQPSLPGWNPGSGLPNNRHARSFGIWDAENSPRHVDAAGHPQDLTHDILPSGEVRKESKANLDDPYEPAHGLTMLAGPSRIVLYGTLLKNNKHRPADSTQKLRSNAVHEALHYDNPVLDQFMVDSADEYDKSYLTDHITGSIFNTLSDSSRWDGSVRAIASSVGTGDLSFSGSFQRFVRISEPSQVFYDTLLQNPFDIAQVDAGLSAGSVYLANTGSASGAVINLHQPTPWAAVSSGEYLGQTPHALSALWSSSFPFEGKYAGVRRMLNRDLSFIDADNVKICLPSSSQTPGIAITPISNLSYLTGSNPDHLNTPWWEYAESSADYSGDILGADVAYGVLGISNMANVASNTNSQGTLIYPGTAAWGIPVKTIGAESISAYRTFSAIMLGVGRQNKRCLDIDRARFLTLIWNVTEPYSLIIAQRMHPSSLKYGYMNSDHINPSIVLRPDRYGQFRDMLEQRLYSKTYSAGDEFNKRGPSTAAVTCIFVDSQGAPITDPHLTQCLNLSTAMTSSKPFIEGETLRELIINTESVTIS